jgi:hypothetical protein
VGGGARHRFEDCCHDAVRIAEHVVVSEAEHRPTLRVEIAGSLRVGGERGVLAAVEFDDELERRQAKSAM